MKILLYGINYNPELTGIGKYTGELAHWSAREGREVGVVAAPAPAYYPDWKTSRQFSAGKFRRVAENKVLAHACVFLMEDYSSPESVNASWGNDMGILEHAQLVKDVVGFEGKLMFDLSRPDGTPRKPLDTTRIQGFSWRPNVEFFGRINLAGEWFEEVHADQSNNLRMSVE
jgi:hypothetical protein